MWNFLILLVCSLMLLRGRQCVGTWSLSPLHMLMKFKGTTIIAVTNPEPYGLEMRGPWTWGNLLSWVMRHWSISQGNHRQLALALFCWWHNWLFFSFLILIKFQTERERLLKVSEYPLGSLCKITPMIASYLLLACVELSLYIQVPWEPGEWSSDWMLWMNRR